MCHLFLPEGHACLRGQLWNNDRGERPPKSMSGCLHASTRTKRIDVFENGVCCEAGEEGKKVGSYPMTSHVYPDTRRRRRRRKLMHARRASN